MEILRENKELYKGIFWIVDQDNLENNKNYCYQISVNSDGNIISNDFISNAKSGNTPVRYEAIIDDNVKISDFEEKYKIIERRGYIYVIDEIGVMTNAR